MPLIVNGVEIENLIVINTATGEQVDIETLQDQLGDILFQKQTAPAWFNYTGIDINGNYEGTSAYDGVAVAYGIGKPTLVTNDDGTITLSNNFAEANGLNDDYFIEKYGDSYIKEWSISSGEIEPLQVVEDTLVIPDTYNDLPITTILRQSFWSSAYYLGNTDKFTQASFYKNIVFGKNITTIEGNALVGANIPLIKLPTTITTLGFNMCGIIRENAEEYTTIPVLEINSNISTVGGSTGLGYTETVIYTEQVTYVKDTASGILGSKTDGYVRVFKQPTDLEVTVEYSSKSKTAITVAIYTDNNSIKNYDWSTNGNVTPTFYPLSDYVG